MAQDSLTRSEWNTLSHLLKEISYNPFAINPSDQELFTELFTRSLKGKGDGVKVSG